jgi:hypothetical protein
MSASGMLARNFFFFFFTVINYLNYIMFRNWLINYQMASRSVEV